LWSHPQHYHPGSTLLLKFPVRSVHQAMNKM
jgi:hypothetical protein